LIAEGRLGPKADHWAMGATAFEALTDVCIFGALADEIEERRGLKPRADYSYTRRMVQRAEDVVNDSSLVDEIKSAILAVFKPHKKRPPLCLPTVETVEVVVAQVNNEEQEVVVVNNAATEAADDSIAAQREGMECVD
jgi:hypothetical protein